ncbi:MAG: DUF6316 family protein [Gammaproteobacteria bacterium]|nr:DUF6316 family protein [Gammaproteobacteria bacterium]
MALNAKAIEGRLFTQEGRLYFVVEVDTEAGFARVSCRAEGVQQVIQMPISEVGLRISSSSNLLLDNLNTTETSTRIVQRPDGWFFTTREGLNGPYLSDTDANLALSRHILSVQGGAARGDTGQRSGSTISP